MKKYVLMILLLAFGCAKETGCVKITLKEETNGRYYFYWGNLTVGIDEDGSGQPLSGSVTKRIYDQYEVGDTFCLD